MGKKKQYIVYSPEQIDRPYLSTNQSICRTSEWQPINIVFIRKSIIKK